MQKILGGAGNMDENVLDFPGNAYRAVTLRTYDPAKGQWSIWWIDSRNPSHLIHPWSAASKTVLGRFMPTTLLRENRFAFVSYGQILLPSRIGSRRSPTTEVTPGKPTGSWNS